MNFEIYITASGVSNTEQNRTVLLTGENLCEIWKKITEQQKAEQKTSPGGGRRDMYQIQPINRYFALKENIPQINTNFLKLCQTLERW